ncbi:hypothetical protein DAMA08_037700 [Martiniozyma asiatica (nom. inval.)]|nr:hypothetical protein DAMA08_037700 [Martiniozyma asiatica]
MNIHFLGVIFAVTALALTDSYLLENEKTLLSCAYVSNCETWHHRLFRVAEPSIQLSFPTENSFNVQIYTLIVGGTDFTKLDVVPYYKVCDEIAMMRGYCIPDAEDKSGISLDQMIGDSNFNYPIESFIFEYNENKNDIHSYSVDKSGVYCVYFHASNLPTNPDGSSASVLIELNWVQAFGKLLISDFHRMFYSVYILIAYLAYFIFYLFIFKKEVGQNICGSFTLNSLKQKQYTFHKKFIILLTGFIFSFSATVCDYAMLNIFDYNAMDFFLLIIKFIEFTVQTISNCWILYHLILFSSGVWFISPYMSLSDVSSSINAFNSTKRWKYKIALYITLFYGLGMLLCDVYNSSLHSLISPFGSPSPGIISETLHLAEITLFIFCLFWSLLSSFNINDTKLRYLYWFTVLSVGSLLCLKIFFAALFSSAKGNAIMDFLTWVTISVLGLCWFNVSFQNEIIVLQ